MWSLLLYFFFSKVIHINSRYDNWFSKKVICFFFSNFCSSVFNSLSFDSWRSIFNFKRVFFTFRILFLCLLYKGLSQYVQIYIFDVSDDTSLNIVKKIFNVFEKKSILIPWNKCLKILSLSNLSEFKWFTKILRLKSLYKT